MATLDALLGTCAENLAALIHDKAAMILGVKEELGKLQRRMDRIDCALKDVAGWRRTKDAATTNCWLSELKSILDEANDVFDDCRHEGGKLLDNELPSAPSGKSILHRIPLISNFSSVMVRYKLADRIRNLNDRIDEVAKDEWILNLELVKSEGGEASTSYSRETCEIMEADVVGREIEDATDELVEMVVTNDRRNFQVIAVTGMGGIGKTTLAQKVYNDPRIKDNFQERIWICISQKYSEARMLQEITRKAGGNHGSAERVSELLPILSHTIGGRSIFLVLDDVWRSDVWTDLLRNPLQNGAASGCVLVTTRDQNVAMRMGAKYIHRVEKMSVDSGWELLCKRTYQEEEEEEEEEDAQSLRSVGVQIVNKCDGLPLAIKVIAGLLTTKEKGKKEWEKVLRSNAWSMSELPEEFRGALYLSYDDLPPHLKQCFLSFCLYPEDDVHYIWDLRRMWVAEGFVKLEEEDSIMEELADQYYKELIRRSLLQPDPTSVDQTRCKVHDLLRSLAQYLSQGESYYGDPQSLDATAVSKLRRLSIAESGEIVTIPGPETKRLSLRTLLLTASPPRIEHNLFSRFPYLQVLLLNGKGIECIPDSVGNLIHLRLLDLDRTGISKLPDSIGLLTNLQTLNLEYCKFLDTLPRSITHLCSLRRLGLVGTPLRCVPEGIRRLQLLNDLQGFIINADDSCNIEQNSWDLKELESLCQLRWLKIYILEGKTNANSVQSLDDTIDQVQTATPGNRTSVLINKDFLKKLSISFTTQTERAEVLPYTKEEISMIEDIFEKLHPPHCLEELRIHSFYGQQFSSWMLSSSLGTYLPYLTYVNFIGLPLCSQLPPLGQLPHLRYLRIKNALAIVTIGPELLGNGVGDGIHTATAFPKLEFLIMVNLPNWEEWSLVGSETGNSSSCSLRVMPCLEELGVVNCPKLRALPKGLQQLRALRRLIAERAHSLSVIEDFLFITNLKILENDSMESVSNLPALKELTIWDIPALKCVTNLIALQYLELEDYSMESLPEWLLRLVQQRVHLHDNNLQLVMGCSAALIQRCLKEGPDWPIIECFSHVSAYTEDRSTYLEYDKQSGRYRTNL